MILEINIYNDLIFKYMLLHYELRRFFFLFLFFLIAKQPLHNVIVI